MPDLDQRVRLAAFEFLDHGRQLHGETLPRALLAQGFEFEGRRVPLLGPEGIFKPAILPTIPLSITTSPPSNRKPRPYNDELDPTGLLRYRYRGRDRRDINHADNIGLRDAMRLRAPLIYFHGIVPSRYMASWPVFIVGDDPATMTFTVAVDDRQLAIAESSIDTPEAEIRRRYVTRLVRQRIHQQAFRERVLLAYREHCAICRLRHEELLEAAHIVPDRDPEGEPRVSNGLALCKLHHAAFDAQILGVRPDYVVEIRTDVLHEIDGPMLKVGLQGFHGARVWVPPRDSLKPNRDFLEERYSQFKGA